MNPITDVSQEFFLDLGISCLKVDLKEKVAKFEVKHIFCYSQYIALQFQPLWFVRLTDRWWTFHKNKEGSFD